MNNGLLDFRTLYPGMTHYRNANTPYRVPDIWNDIKNADPLNVWYNATDMLMPGVSAARNLAPSQFDIGRGKGSTGEGLLDVALDSTDLVPWAKAATVAGAGLGGLLTMMNRYVPEDSYKWGKQAGAIGSANDRLQQIPISVHGLLANDEVGNLATRRVQREIPFGSELSEEGTKYVKWVERNQNKSAVHRNQKTGFSIDFSTTCPKKNCKSGACAYCYVEQPRTQKKIGMGVPMSPKKEDALNPYRGELQAMPADVVNELNRDGGIRMFSFGDYRPDVDFENVAGVLNDAQQKGLYVKAITKERALIDQFGDHPNFRANISVDNMPRHLSNAPTVEEALEWKANRPNIKVRAVALNEEEARMYAADPRVDVVTLYHGTTGEKLINTVKAQNPELFARDAAGLEMELSKWQNMPPRSKVAKQLQQEHPGRFCCLGGKCAKDNNKCGFGLGALLTGVMLPEWMPGAEHGEEDAPEL